MPDIRDFDWSATPLGPRAQWPQSLVTTYEIMMGTPFAMCACWGPELTLIYNDSYAPILGNRHPAAMGRPFREAWPEVWDEISPLIDRALAGQAVAFDDMHLVMTRNGYEEDTWWSFAYSPLKDDDGKIAGFLDVVVDSTQKVLNRKRLEQEQERVRKSEERLRALVDASSDAIYRMSPDWREMRELEGRGNLADLDHPSDRWMQQYLFPEDIPQITAQIDAAIAAKAPFELEHRVRRADGSVGWTISRAIPVLGDDGEIVEWFGTADDVTERKRDAEHLRLVVNELNHRVKNNLAMVQAIAMQTFRRAADIEDAIERFSARLIALARANDLLTGERWAQVDLAGAIEQATNSHRGHPDRLRIEGPEVQISAKSALAFTLALHELATNAIKHGAWSVPGGTAIASWTIEPGDGERPDRLIFEWRESGGPAVAAPASRGFGSRLIERALAGELGGTAQLSFPAEGAVCHVEMPLNPRNRA